MKRFKLSKIKLITILEISVLVIISSYAWFSNKSNPSISQNDIKVTSAEGLIIRITPDSDARTEVDLNQILGDLSNFELKQVSSLDTKNFFTIDFGEGLSKTDPQFIKVRPDGDGYIDFKKWGYFDFDFYLQTEDFAKHIYINKDSFVNGLAEKAIRIALTYQIDGEEEVVIFGETREDGTTTYPYTTKAVIKEGFFEYNNIASEFIGNQNVFTFSDYNGGRGIDDSSEIDLSKVLLTIPAGNSIKINMKVWLEGGDIECNNTLSSTISNMLVKFGSANVLLDAPNVTPNNATVTINNLTNAMEYAYSNDQSTIWTKVTNPNMTFTRGTTVYVRIAEVTGVTPASYVTRVVFN